jgi:hypothetical protein
MEVLAQVWNNIGITKSNGVIRLMRSQLFVKVPLSSMGGMAEALRCTPDQLSALNTRGTSPTLAVSLHTLCGKVTDNMLSV